MGGGFLHLAMSASVYAIEAYANMYGRKMRTKRKFKVGNFGVGCNTKMSTGGKE